jgi:hypothetical protein
MKHAVAAGAVFGLGFYSQRCGSSASAVLLRHGLTIRFGGLIQRSLTRGKISI